MSYYRARTLHYPDGGVETVVWSLTHYPENRLPSLRPSLPKDPGEQAYKRLQTSASRAKRQVRVLCRWWQLDRLLTLTTREKANTPDQLVEDWAAMRRILLDRWPTLRYVAVVEAHPSNPGHYHMHVALRGYRDVRFIRRAWAVVLARRGVEGNPDMAYRPGVGPRKLASYLGKYVAKTIGDGGVVERGRKAYFRPRHLPGEERPVWVYWYPAAATAVELEVEVADPELNGVLPIWRYETLFGGIWYIEGIVLGGPVMI